MEKVAYEKIESRKKKLLAFTLVELLVVISIIALLLAVLLPSLQKAKGLAVRVVCNTQLKDLGLAIGLYISDNDDKLPDCLNPDEPASSGNHAGNRWMKKLARYYGRATDYATISSGGSFTMYDYELFRCPTQKRFVNQWQDAAEAANIIGGAGAVGCYGYNEYFTGVLPVEQTCRKYSKIRKSNGRLPLMADLNGCDPIYESPRGVSGWLLRTEKPHPDAILKYKWTTNGLTTRQMITLQQWDFYGPAPNHDGRTNYLYADFHCETSGEIWPWRDHLGTDFNPL